jgi:hypothetical protein
MARLIAYFRKVHQTVISGKVAGRLAHTVRAMRQVDGTILLGVTGADVSALLPRHVDVPLRELRAVLSRRRVSA